MAVEVGQAVAVHWSQYQWVEESPGSTGQGAR